ncbi:MAG: hypothetical protein WC295_06370, partial [Methanoregula sp.]
MHGSYEIRKLQENPELYGKPLRKPLHRYGEIDFEKKFRIFFTIDRVNHGVYIEAISYKDECQVPSSFATSSKSRDLTFFA